MAHTPDPLHFCVTCGQPVDPGFGDWQPIETAPKDGTTIFGCNYKLGQRGMVSFNGHEWEMVDGLINKPMGIGFYPTHWMPLPAPPEPPP